MKYFLGRFKNGKYEPIPCIEETDILSVINFTSRYNDEIELRQDLKEKGLIDGDEVLGYVGKRKDEYIRIPNGLEITYSFAKEYNTSKGVYDTLKKEKYNLELYEYLADCLINKYRNVDHQVAELKCIKEVLREVINANEMGIDRYQKTLDKDNLDTLIRNFVRASIGIYDKNNKCYKTIGNQYDWDKRKLADLILLINGYYNSKAFVKPLEDQKENNDSYEEIDDNEKEEFLTDEDFENYGYDPDNFRRLIRN